MVKYIITEPSPTIGHNIYLLLKNLTVMNVTENTIIDKSKRPIMVRCIPCKLSTVHSYMHPFLYFLQRYNMIGL